MGAPPILRKSPSHPPSSPPPQPAPPPPLPKPRRKPRTPLSSPLPSLRLLLHPRPGLGLDLRLPLSHTTRCYMQLDSYFNGPSTIRIGLHPRNFAGVRFQLSPTPSLSVRLPVRLAGAKYLHLGLAAEGTWGMGGDWRLSEVRKLGWSVAPLVEVWRYTTAAGMVDRRVKEGLREAVRRRKIAGGLDGRGLDGVPVDPREREQLVEAFRDVLRRRERGPDEMP